MQIQLFSLSHIIYLLIAAAICVAFYFIFRNKSQKTKYIALLVPLILAFIIHFLKLLIPLYRNDLPHSIISLTGETLCAISTLTFPFIYLSKNKWLKDYMVIVGTISGFLTLIIPGEVSGFNALDIEVVRFFFAHLVIFMVPLFTYIFNIYRPKEKWLKHTLIVLLIITLIIPLNNLMFTFILDGKQAGMEYAKKLGFIR